MVDIAIAREDVADYPLLTPVVAAEFDRDHGTGVVTTRISPEEHPYLASHVFGGLPIMPGAMMVDLVSEAAALTCAKLGFPAFVTEVEHFRIFRVIGAKSGETIEIKTSATLVERSETRPGDRVLAVSVTSDVRSPAGKVVRASRKHCEATVTTSQRSVEPQFANMDVLESARVFKVGKERLYGAVIRTHGPLLKSLTGRFWVLDDGNSICGEFDMGNLESEFIRNSSTPFVMSPLALDSAFQVQVAAGIYQLGRKRLPIGGRHIKFFRRPNPDGIHLALVQHVSDTPLETVSRIVVMTEDFEKCCEIEAFIFRQAEIAGPALVDASLTFAAQE